MPFSPLLSVLQLVNCGLSEVTIKALAQRGILALFPIQKHVYEPAAAGMVFFKAYYDLSNGALGMLGSGFNLLWLYTCASCCSLNVAACLRCTNIARLYPIQSPLYQHLCVLAGTHMKILALECMATYSLPACWLHVIPPFLQLQFALSDDKAELIGQT